MIRLAPILVTSAGEFEQMLGRLLAEPSVAVDSESDSLYSYFEKVCLVQFSIPDADYILDPLAVRQAAPGVALGAALAPLFGDPRIQKVFHAAEYDILGLKRDFELSFENIFDTMVGARILGWKQVGLGSILQAHFGVRLDKRFQRADWGRRPLPRELIEYAREDTHYLLALRDEQKAELELKGRLDEAQEEFEQLTRAEWTEREFDPQRYWTLDGARNLDPVGLGILRELYHLRDMHARKEDRPPFKVIGNATMVQIAHARPRNLDELTRISGVGDWLVRRYGRGILGAVEKGDAQPQLHPPRVGGPGRPFRRMVDNAARDRFARLKEWRRTRAEARGVEFDVIVSNDVLMRLAQKNPKTREDLAKISELGQWKAREYGEELLRVLRGEPPQ